MSGRRYSHPSQAHLAPDQSIVTQLCSIRRAGYDKSSKIAYFAMDNDRVDDSAKMITAYCSLFGEGDHLLSE